MARNQSKGTTKLRSEASYLAAKSQALLKQKELKETLNPLVDAYYNKADALGYTMGTDVIGEIAYDMSEKMKDSLKQKHFEEGEELMDYYDDKASQWREGEHILSNDYIKNPLKIELNDNGEKYEVSFVPTIRYSEQRVSKYDDYNYPVDREFRGIPIDIKKI